MKNKEKWVVIDLESIVGNTDIDKVFNCYDFKGWEREEIKALQNDTSLSNNEFRWQYILETLSLTDDTITDIGQMARDLIDDIKMGYHKIPVELLIESVENENSDIDIYKNVKEMNFGYKPYRDFETNKICAFEIYFDDCNISMEQKNDEIEELLTYLNLDKNEIIRFI